MVFIANIPTNHGITYTNYVEITKSNPFYWDDVTPNRHLLMRRRTGQSTLYIQAISVFTLYSSILVINAVSQSEQSMLVNWRMETTKCEFERTC